MQIEAIYNNGKLEIPQSIRLARERFKVKVEIPDKEIANSGTSRRLSSAIDRLLADQPGNAWLLRLKEIEEEVLSIPEDELPELTPKQLQHIDAFAMRDER